MSGAKLTDDGLDACYQMSEAAPRARALPSTTMLLRGAAYSVLIIGALGVGLLAMQPSGTPLDKLLNELFGSATMQPGCRDSGCCPQLQLEIPNTAPANEATSPAAELAAEDSVSDDLLTTSADEATEF